MFGTEIIEVGIGLVFAYFSISVICSGIVELGVKLTKLRARHLKMALGKLLDDKHYNGFVGELYKHHLISSPLRDKLGDPTSILARDFSAAVLEILGKDDKLSEAEQFQAIETRIMTIQDHATRERLLAILRSSANHFDTLRAKIENWFNESMESVSEWYRQRMRTWVTIVSIVVVGVMNADTIHMATMFWNDDELRTATVEAAQGYAKTMQDRMNAASPVPDSTGGSTGAKPVLTPDEKALQDLDAIRGTLNALNQDINATKVLPIGWASETLPLAPGWDHSKDPVMWWLVKVAGLILTIGAVSLGSTYWYKQLQSLLRFRFGKQQAEPTPAPDPVPPTYRQAPPAAGGADAVSPGSPDEETGEGEAEKPENGDKE